MKPNHAFLTLPPNHSTWIVHLINAFIILCLVVTPNETIIAVQTIHGCRSHYHHVNLHFCHKSPLKLALNHSLLHLPSAFSIASDGWAQVFQITHLHDLYSTHVPPISVSFTHMYTVLLQLIFLLFLSSAYFHRLSTITTDPSIICKHLCRHRLLPDLIG